MQRTYIHSILPSGVSQSGSPASPTPRNPFDTNVKLPSPDMPIPPNYMYLLQELLVFSRLSNSGSSRPANRKRLWDELLDPFDRAVLSPLPERLSFPLRLIHVAGRHLQEHPCEIGGPNRGPWVRLYMKGHDGDSFPWCAGFVSTVIEQTVGSGPVPIPYCYSCSALADKALSRGMFVTDPDASTVRPGWIFLCRNASGGRSHTGFVEKVNGSRFTSIEGNASTVGGAEGNAVCRRVRRVAGKDFIVVGRRATASPQYCGRRPQ